MDGENNNDKNKHSEEEEEEVENYDDGDGSGSENGWVFLFFFSKYFCSWEVKLAWNSEEDLHARFAEVILLFQFVVTRVKLDFSKNKIKNREHMYKKFKINI